MDSFLTRLVHIFHSQLVLFEGQQGSFKDLLLIDGLVEPDMDKQKVFEGTLVSFEEDELTMEYMDKTRKKTVQIPYSLVSKAILSFL